MDVREMLGGWLLSAYESSRPVCHLVFLAISLPDYISTHIRLYS